MTNDPKARPLSKPVGVLALMGGLPALLKLAEVLELWFPWNEAKALPRMKLERRAALQAMQDAIADGSLKAERDPDKKRTVHAPAGGFFTGYRANARSDELGELHARTAPREVTDGGETWLRPSDVLAWARTLPALWPPADDCLLLKWVGAAAVAERPAVASKKVPAKAYLSDVDQLIAEGRGVGEALRQVAAGKGVTVGSLKKARSENSGGKRKLNVGKAKPAPRLQLVRSGEK